MNPRLRNTLITAVLIAAVLLGIVYLLSRQHFQGSAHKDVDAGYTFDLKHDAGKLRIYWVSADGERILLRNRSVEPGFLKLSDTKKRRQVAAQEKDAVRRWQAALTPLNDHTFTRPEEEHNALLESVELLEKIHWDDTEHLGVLRDLILTSIRLLEYERSTGLGSNICLLTSQRVEAYERLAAPLDQDETREMTLARAWLSFFMGHYPQVAGLLSALPDDPDTTYLRTLLSAFGQGSFDRLVPFSTGPFTIQPYQVLNSSPDPDLLFGDVHFMVAGEGRQSPHRTIRYTLARQGEQDQLRYYLYFHSLNRKQLIALYGRERPSLAALEKSISQHISVALAEGTER